MMSFLEENRVNLFRAEELREVVFKGFDQMPDQRSNSCCIIDLGRIAKAASGWKELFPQIKLLQKAGSLSDKVIFNFLTRLGVRLTSATGVEIEKLVNAGVEPKDIFYNGLCKINRHIKIACSVGVKDLTFSSFKELNRIVALYPQASLCYRLYFNGSVAFNSQDVKFMIEDTRAVISKVKQLKLKLEGVCCDLFLSGAEFEEKVWIETLSLLIEVVVSSDVGTKYINLGSGEGVRRLTDSAHKELAEQVNSMTAKYSNLEFYAEPNEYILGTSALICCSVVTVKKMSTETYYYLNDGVYGSFSKCVFAGLFSAPIFFQRQETDGYSGTKTPATFWGPTCDSMDKVCEVKECPQLAVDDLVVFDTMGCQSAAAATTFNGFPLPSNVYCFSFENLGSVQF